ncbi:MAG: Unknown protein [uncultured Campylobacterales bacterium]|uniref:Uncharacterized protein n=1 Tax=uncultured Campylobacterales bacterium TaxID=352960 RepID=A0A6S6SPF7_9BACT|nr:MAG: Unknown protein [uncultured Campylobacterales bacterium]
MIYIVFLNLDIDKCLDSGGKWDYDRKECIKGIKE